MLNKYVIDTSLFVNPHAREKFGKTPSAAVRSFIKKLAKQDMEVYMPPSIFNELRNFVDQKTMDELELEIKKRSPNTYSIYLPAAVLYDFIEDIRKRMNKGMKLAEDFAQDNRPDNDTKLRKLRDKYRDAMRAGIVDSKEDFELVLLCKELEATLISSDEGVIKFADQIGCEWLPGSRFYALMSKKSAGRKK
ncbi:RNA ligase partner protein [Candidatus Micrarchaeota archaeon]|nr:RNA ligase partner protein [Candidatus Micrarchaeota archaeon]MBU1166353.1 RNA ligase partner protein [Candidatus Micrarchaeota archaeon]MBU1886240.1 RNA ligase partner protein [Candidatus Micrarchaeota archaeon]